MSKRTGLTSLHPLQKAMINPRPHKDIRVTQQLKILNFFRDLSQQSSQILASIQMEDLQNFYRRTLAQTLMSIAIRRNNQLTLHTTA